MLRPLFFGDGRSGSLGGASAASRTAAAASCAFSGGSRLKTLSSRPRSGESPERESTTASLGEATSFGRFGALNRAEKRLIRHYVASPDQDVKELSVAVLPAAH